MFRGQSVLSGMMMFWLVGITLLTIGYSQTRPATTKAQSSSPAVFPMGHR
jgi:hypothetical protein